MRVVLVLAAVGTAAGALAVTGVVPNAFAGTEGPGTFALTTNTAGGRTFQLQIAASQLTSFVNTNLTGMAFRLNSGGNWPAIPVSMSFFDIFVGPGVAPSAMSNTFASNFTGGVTQVRNGSISFNPGDFPTGGTPNAFGPNINFNLAPYFYAGGDLSIMMRFATQAGTGGTPTQSPLDAVAASDTGNGWGTLFAVRWTGSSAGTTGGNANFLVTRLTASAVPEPASIAVLSLGAAVLLRRRRIR